MNDTLKEIKDDISRAKLQGIQESVSVIDEGIVRIQDGMKQQQGAASILPIIVNRIMADCAPINASVDANEMSPEEAKIRISQITQVAAIVRGYLEETKLNIHAMYGEVKGLNKAAQNLQQKFDAEASKYMRWQRQQEEDAEEKKESDNVKTKSASKTVKKTKKITPKPKKK